MASPDGEAKFWLDPIGELARNQGLTEQDIREIRQTLERRQQEVRNAWNEHFGS